LLLREIVALLDQTYSRQNHECDVHQAGRKPEQC
jgi:hypothetical protein